MVGKGSECLNSLRVASKDWPGFVHYQGITTQTALCAWGTTSRDKQQPRMSKNRSIVLSNKSVKSPSSHHTITEGDQNESQCHNSNPPTSTNERNCDDENDNDETDAHSNSASLLSTSTSSGSTNSILSSGSTESNTSEHGQRGRSSLSIPFVSCNELTSEEEKESEVTNTNTIVKRTYLNNREILSRPHTAGPRIIVPPKHTCPEGLTVKDFVQGVRFDSDKRPCTSHGDRPSLSKSDLDPDTFGHSTTSCDWSYLSPSRRTEQCQSFRRVMRPLTRCSITEERAISLELTITSINPPTRTNVDCLVKTNEVSDGSITSEKEPESSSKHHHGGATNSKHSLVDTIEGIRKSYQRARSAPPTHCRNQYSSGTSTSDSNSEDKQFSNLYYRAKSAYHKRQDPSITNATNGEKERTETPGSLKGSLLRPLLDADVNGPLNHGKGCPYKCKSCFKACLVSQDYVRKAVERSLQEQQQQSKQRTRSASSNGANRRGGHISGRCYTSVDIVTQALGRSQPLFHRVYGNKHRHMGWKIPMKPWPKYGWVDFTARKQGDNIPTD